MTDELGDDWRPWLWMGWHRPPYGDLPQHYDQVEAYREGWGETAILRPDQLPGEFNVAGLYWRPIGPPKPLDAGRI